MRSEARHFFQRDLGKISQEETCRHPATDRLSADSASSAGAEAGNQVLVLGGRPPLTLAPPLFQLCPPLLPPAEPHNLSVGKHLQHPDHPQGV